jgi:pilus assembly protein FimV
VANKTDQTLKYIGLRTSVMAVASCLALAGIPLAAHAAGLGKIVVLSALGQVLRAEIEVSATREELAEMKAQLASQDAFKQAGLDYATTLLGIRFNLDKRANGQSVIRLSSDKPINDPFVDLLLELNWPTGRLVREYTFLLDPPEVAAKASAPAAAATVRPAPAAIRPADSARAATTPVPIDDEVRRKAVARIRAQEQQPAEQPVEKRAEQPVARRDVGAVREVRRGDTLNRIANETKPQGVSLDQMLVGLLRANQDAFDGGNMNRLKAGKILSLPEKSALEAVSAGEARRIVAAQSSDWNAYRSKLAGVAAQAPAREATASQESAGKITAKVEDRAAPAVEPKDQLKVSTSAEKAASKSGAGEKRSEEDAIAKDKALNEARQRTLALEKNVADLQKLVELKEQNLAQLQKQAAESVAPVEPPKAAPVAPPVVATEKPAEPLADAKPAEARSDEVKAEAAPEPTPVEVPKPVEPAKPLTPPTPPPPAAEEPGIVDQLLDNPLALAGGAGILALIAALLVVRRRRANQDEPPLSLGSSLSQQFSGLTANSIFRSTGGQSVDTSHGPAQTDFSQAGPGSIDTDEVDPVAEADVYMAYGRDVQAEEILVEARQKDPKRHAIHLKLLEIYANRKDLQQFETLAGDLYGETAGVGADWEKAAAMGLKLDPDNPLYAIAATPLVAAVAAAVDPNATLIVAAPAMNETISMPGELSQLADAASAGEEAPPADLMSLDFDLGLGDDKALPAADGGPATVDEGAPQAAAGQTLDFDVAADIPAPSRPVAPPAVDALDFDFPESPAAVVPPAPRVVPPVATLAQGDQHELADLDFDLGLEPAPEEEITEFQPRIRGYDALAPIDDPDVKFDVKLTESTFLGQTMPDASSFDLSSIDLDLDEHEVAIPSVPSAAASEAAPGADSGADSVPDLPAVSGKAPAATDSNFSAAQSATLITGRSLLDQEYAEEDDFAVVQGETHLNPQLDDALDLPETEVVASEDVTTKLDLAKAYEEMGDLEGARELLQEVLVEGDAAQRAKAQFVLAKIGE